LLEDAGEEIALTFFQKAHAIVPKDPVIAANLASSYLIRLRAAESKSLAQISLSVEPKQARVLIDLAAAEWLLGELDNAEKHAREAASLRPDLPGPHITLTLIAIVKNHLPVALKEAEIGVKLSERHPYYLAIQAIAFDAAGKKDEADKNIAEAWNGNNPSEEQLKKWFLKDKPLNILLAILNRQKPTKK
jgi:tetratricopeptide (TPR) repeat protein